MSDECTIKGIKARSVTELNVQKLCMCIKLKWARVSHIKHFRSQVYLLPSLVISFCTKPENTGLFWLAARGKPMGEKPRVVCASCCCADVLLALGYFQRHLWTSPIVCSLTCTDTGLHTHKDNRQSRVRTHTTSGRLAPTVHNNSIKRKLN